MHEYHEYTMERAGLPGLRAGLECPEDLTGEPHDRKETATEHPCSQFRCCLWTDNRNMLLGLRETGRLPDGGGGPALHKRSYRVQRVHVVGDTGLLRVCDR
jgi:hypothetical protein